MKRNSRILFLFMFFLLIFLNSITGVEIGGYFEYQYSVMNLEKSESLNLNKLRLDFKYEKSPRVTFNADFVIENYNGLTEIPVRYFVPEYVHPVLPFFQYYLPEYYVYENRQYLDNGYISIYSKLINLRLGKQQLNWGVGYFWRPVDLFNYRDVIQPDYEKEGINAVKLEIPFTGFWKIQATYIPEENYENSQHALRLKGHLLNFDLELFTIEARHNSVTNLTVGQLEEKIELYGGTLSGQIFGFGAWGEYGYRSFDGFKEGYSRYILGLDYTFGFQTYFMLEWYKNDEVKTFEQRYRYERWIDYAYGFTNVLGSEYFGLYLNHPLTDLMEFSVSGIYNGDDSSSLINIELLYNLENNAELRVFYFEGFGDENTEFSIVPESIYLYLRYYF